MNLSELLTNPKGFFEELKEQQPNSSRYIWLIFLTGVISAIGAYLAQAPMNDALAGIPGMPSFMSGPAFKILTSLMGGIFASLLGWLMMWGLGMAGAGKEGRAAEVYGASFVISLVASIILIPLYLLMPIQFNVVPPDFSNLEPQELGKAIQQYQLQLQKEISKNPITTITNVLNIIILVWQLFVAWIGFNVITGDRTKAFKGVLFPGILLIILSVGGWLIGQMNMGMGS